MPYGPDGKDLTLENAATEPHKSVAENKCANIKNETNFVEPIWKGDWNETKHGEYIQYLPFQLSKCIN
jgi:hypothetical protein